MIITIAQAPKGREEEFKQIGGQVIYSYDGVIDVTLEHHGLLIDDEKLIISDSHSTSIMKLNHNEYCLIDIR